ncbi:autotransporter outer membrane beta-barrel domain-containing protein, partial [Sphingomonas sp.]|uniref:autotransporter outer membrane beta-barrel domain-containing protein n=1 Tax=Sphingomonas sp. TaxID=28214 RepID=UPI00286C39CB
RDFGTGVVGCQPGDERGAKCVFGRVDGHRLDSKGGEMDVDFAASARLRLGGAVSAGNGWRVGGSLGFDDVGNLEADNSRTKGTGGFGFHAGLGIGKLFAGDRGEASLALTLGSQHYATERFQNIFEPGVGHATIRTRYVGANAGLGFTLSSGTLFATPAIDLQAIRMTIGDFAESGLDGTGARSDGTSDWYLSATPKLTAGVKSGAIKLSGTVGYQLSDKGQIVAPIRLIGSPDASDPAMIRTLIDKEMLMLGANVEVQANSNAALQFGFKGLYGDRVKSESANVKLVVRF